MLAKRIVLLLLLSSLITRVAAQSPYLHWGFGNGSLNGDHSAATALDAAGNVYVVGDFYFSPDFDPGPGSYPLTANGYGLFIQKLAPDGSLAWARALSGALNTASEYTHLAIAQDGSVYVTGRFSGTMDFDPGAGIWNVTASNYDVFVLKLDAGGLFQWVKTLGGPGYTAVGGLSVDALGDLALAGGFTGTLDLDPGAGVSQVTAVGDVDLYILKLDAAGDLVWSKSIGGLRSEEIEAITFDQAGNIYAAGWYMDAMDFDPGPGTFALSTAPDSLNSWIMKWDAAGTFSWAGQVVGGGLDHFWNIVAGPSGDLYAAGTLYGSADYDPGPGIHNLQSGGSQDIVVCRYHHDGSLRWAFREGGTGGDAGTAISVDAAENLYVTGSYTLTCDLDPGPGTAMMTSTGGSETFVQKLDSSGNLLDVFSIGSSEEDIGWAIAADAVGDLVVTGWFYVGGTSDFDPGPGTLPLTSHGSYDYYVLKFGVAPLEATPSQGPWAMAAWPNPVSDQTVQLQFAEPLQAATLSVFDALGKRLFQATDVQGDQFQLALPGPTGIYHITVADQGRSGSIQVVKR